MDAASARTIAANVAQAMRDVIQLIRSLELRYIADFSRRDRMVENIERAASQLRHVPSALDAYEQTSGEGRKWVTSTLFVILFPVSMVDTDEIGDLLKQVRSGHGLLALDKWTSVREDLAALISFLEQL